MLSRFARYAGNFSTRVPPLGKIGHPLKSQTGEHAWIYSIAPRSCSNAVGVSPSRVLVEGGMERNNFVYRRGLYLFSHLGSFRCSLASRVPVWFTDPCPRAVSRPSVGHGSFDFFFFLSLYCFPVSPTRVNDIRSSPHYIAG